MDVIANSEPRQMMPSVWIQMPAHPAAPFSRIIPSSGININSEGGL